MSDDDVKYADQFAGERAYTQQLVRCNCAGKFRPWRMYLGIWLCKVCGKLQEHEPVRINVD